MTFSDSRIIEAVSKSFTPVWESVSPVAVAVFDLGDGKSVRGTIGGEIALYFCRPDGMVFDCLPALQSPAVTLAAIARAAKFYEASKGAPDEAIIRYNEQRRDTIAEEHGITTELAADTVAAAHKKLKQRLAMGAVADDMMTVAVLAKSGMAVASETITVVEPGGLWLYSIQIHDAIAQTQLRRPLEWKRAVFEKILDQKLDGKTQTFSSLSVEPMSIIEDDG